MTIGCEQSFAVAGLGCKVAQYDAEALAAELEERGLIRLDRPEGAGILLVNTCTVTSRADYQVRQLIRRLAREHPTARIVVTGCYAERDAETLRDLPGVELVLDQGQRELLGAMLAPGADEPVPERGADGARDHHFGRFPDHDPGRQSPSTYFHRILRRFSGRSRPFLKIQDGCDDACTYCIVPSVRGPSRSLPWPQIEQQVRVLAFGGFREVVLAGVHLGRWGDDLANADLTGTGPTSGRSADSAAPGLDPSHPTNLAGLLLRLLALELPLRYRLSSIEPLEFSGRLLETAAASPVVTRHFHLPLQSGSDRVLEQMNRPYRAGQFGALVKRIRASLPGACLGADVIVGFPGEREADFEETLGLVVGLDLNYLHVFPFSPRPGTPAAELPGRPHGNEVRRRSKLLRELSERRRKEFAERFIGEELELVVLKVPEQDDQPAAGLSGNYIRVEFPAGPSGGMRKGALVTVRVTGAGANGLTGNPV